MLHNDSALQFSVLREECGDVHRTNLEKNDYSNAVYSVQCACKMAVSVNLLQQGLFRSTAAVLLCSERFFTAGDTNNADL